MKQTAVEWLVEMLDLPLNNYLIEQAKEMEKEQIKNAWIATDNELQRIAAEEYYNETFNNESKNKN
jgi:hypothetical protein